MYLPELGQWTFVNRNSKAVHAFDGNIYKLKDVYSGTRPGTWLPSRAKFFRETPAIAFAGMDGPRRSSLRQDFSPSALPE